MGKGKKPFKHNTLLPTSRLPQSIPFFFPPNTHTQTFTVMGRGPPGKGNLHLSGARPLDRIFPFLAFPSPQAPYSPSTFFYITPPLVHTIFLFLFVVVVVVVVVGPRPGRAGKHRIRPIIVHGVSLAVVWYTQEGLTPNTKVCKL